MENIEFDYGSVYFFRHIGLTPVKIGYSTNESPINRFEQFKTYAPYGAEIVGFIQTTEAKEIETRLHNKYQSKRLNGEWFELTDDEIKKEIEIYTSVEISKQKSQFEYAWAKHLKKINELKKKTKEETIKDSIELAYHENENFNRSQLAKVLNISRVTVIRHIRLINKVRQGATNVTPLSQVCPPLTH
jgi:hypothetical protein